MIITCTTCSTRLQIEDEKAPVGSFTLRCPKCRNLVKGKREIPNNSNLSSKQLPAGGIDKPKAAPAYKPAIPHTHNQTIDSKKSVQASVGGDENPLLQTLIALLQQGTGGVSNSPNGSARYDWGRQRALVCVEEIHREKIAHLLAEKNYQVYIAEDAPQAVERIREEKMNLVLLSPLFDIENVGQGAVRQEFDYLRPADRRRLFVVLLTEDQKTMDNHASFLQNVNLIVNPKDIDALPRALDISIGAFNELYHNFNDALGIGPIG